MWKLDEGVIFGLLAVVTPFTFWLFFGDWVIDRFSRRRRRRHAH